MIGDEPGIKRETNIAGKAMKVLAYPVSGFIGYWVTRNHIRHSTFTKLKEEGELGDIIDKYRGQKAELNTKMRHATSAEEKQLFKAETRTLSHKYTEDLRKRFEELGLNKMGAQMDEIYKQQTHKAFIEGFTALSISLGGFLIIANSPFMSRVSKKLHHEDDKEQGQQR